MAKRPIFEPDLNGFPYVKEVYIDFKWYPGFAKSQAQKSISSLHAAAEKQGISPVLEISSKSTESLGVSLSAFNLLLKVQNGHIMSVECAYQGSKVFENGGPYADLYSVSSREAKTDERLRNSGDLVAFNFMGEDFPSYPTTAFYDWLYIGALWQNLNLAQQLVAFRGFSDIAFNPKRSLNCQARSAALFVSLYQSGLIEPAVQEKSYYLKLMTDSENQISSSKQEAYQLNISFPQRQ